MKKDDQDWLEDLPEAFKIYRAGRDVDEVECIVPDLAGMSRGKAMPARKFNPQHETYLPVSIFYQTITGADVEMDIDNQWAEGDLVLKPDMSTAKAVPWAKDADPAGNSRPVYARRHPGWHRATPGPQTGSGAVYAAGLEAGRCS